MSSVSKRDDVSTVDTRLGAHVKINDLLLPIKKCCRVARLLA